jgi:hypothetical protein
LCRYDLKFGRDNYQQVPKAILKKEYVKDYALTAENWDTSQQVVTRNEMIKGDQHKMKLPTEEELYTKALLQMKQISPILNGDLISLRII